MTVTLEGSVTSGLGRGKQFVALPGYARQFEELLGYEPYPGTLNLDLSGPTADRLSRLDPIRIEGWEDGDRSFGAVNCYPASVVDGDSVPIHAVVPDRTDHDASTLELVSPVSLRERFDLADGDALAVRIDASDADAD